MESIYQCNKLFAEKTLHPLASVIDLSAPNADSGTCCRPPQQVRPDSYCIMVELNGNHKPQSSTEGHCSNEVRGKVILKPQTNTTGLRSCDFTDGTILFSLPSKVVDINKKSEGNGRIVLFHPSLLIGTPLGKHISSYSFFKYRKDEALHVSAAELRDINHVINDIEKELKRGIDEYSATILSNNIELLLNYCLRFYHRQFIMRYDADDSEFRHFAKLVDDYLTSGRVRRTGMPCGACRFTQQMNMSSAYLADLVRNETGKTVTEYAQLRRVELAKQMIIANKDSDAKIALTLGYANIDEFQQIFKKLTGTTTEEYRK